MGYLLFLAAILIGGMCIGIQGSKESDEKKAKATSEYKKQHGNQSFIAEYNFIVEDLAIDIHNNVIRYQGYDGEFYFCSIYNLISCTTSHRELEGYIVQDVIIRYRTLSNQIQTSKTTFITPYEAKKFRCDMEKYGVVFYSN